MTPRKPSPSKGAQTRAKSEPASPAIPVDPGVLIQAIADIRTRLESLATEQQDLRRDLSDRGSNVGATAEAVRRLHFNNPAPSAASQPVGVISSDREPN